MKPKIILAPGLRENEFLKSLAANGTNTFNLRVMSATELSRYALTGLGIMIKASFLTIKEERAIIAEVMKNVSYFEEMSYSDIVDVTDVIRNMRLQVTAAEERDELWRVLSKGKFIEKNEALMSVYDGFISACERLGCMDSISLVREAIQNGATFDAEFTTLSEYPLNPLEEKLLEVVSNGRYKTSSIMEMYHVTESAIKIKKYTDCYGISNEVENVIDAIYRGMSNDGCVIAVSSVSKYSQMFYDYALRYDINITFGCGIPIVNSNPAKLLRLYYYWSTAGFFGGKALENMISDISFNEYLLWENCPNVDFNDRQNLLVFLRKLKLSNSEADNEIKIDGFEKSIAAMGAKRKKQAELFLDAVRYFGKELSLPPEEFIKKYSRMYKKRDCYADSLRSALDDSAISFIYNDLSISKKSGMEQSDEDLIKSILKANVCKQQSRPGCIHVTDISGAMSLVRKHLFILGMSASMFPGKPRENYLLLDDDIIGFGESSYHLLSSERITHKKVVLKNLVRLYCSLGSEVYVSFSGMNVSELKDDIESSVIYELASEENGYELLPDELKARIEKCNYFDPAVSISREIGNAYNEGKLIFAKDLSVSRGPEKIRRSYKRMFSPVSLDTFFQCQRMFMYKYLLRISVPDKENAFDVISPADRGILAHRLMEELGNSNINKEDFLYLAKENFDNYLLENPPLIAGKVESALEEFLSMMNIAYDMNPGTEVIMHEEELHAEHESGIKLYGVPDRIEMLPDGRCVVVEYKTGRSVKHSPNDPVSCLQVLVYCYMLEKMGYTVSHAEYRYIGLDKRIIFEYGRLRDHMNIQLGDLLDYVRSTFSDGAFKAVKPIDGKKPEACMYCGYSDICHKMGY